MTTSFDHGLITLTGKCGAEDADELLTLVTTHPGAEVDISRAEGIHTALWQVLLASHAPIIGRPAQPFSSDLILSALGMSGLNITQLERPASLEDETP